MVLIIILLVIRRGKGEIEERCSARASNEKLKRQYQSRLLQ
jgi:hypothetical protein